MKVLAIASITKPLTAGGFAKYELMHLDPLAPLGLVIPYN
jgi:hypothetical protein